MQGTRAGELAMFILIESPFTVACDSPDDYKDKDGKYLLGMDFLKGLPTVWDETRGLAGEVGKYVVEARRNGKNWYLAAISDRNARELPVPLKFLGKGDWKVTPVGGRARQRPERRAPGQERKDRAPVRHAATETGALGRDRGDLLAREVT